MADKKTYAVLTCDIIHSRKFETVDLLEVLHRTLDEVNEKFKEIIHRPMTIMFGDSIQGVLSEPEFCFDVFEHLEERLWLYGAEKFGKKNPVLVRCGIGIGSIKNPDEEHLGEMTGDAFQLARNALDTVKEKQRSISTIAYQDLTQSLILSILFNLVSLLKANWSLKARIAVNMRRDGFTINQIGEESGISFQAVSQSLQICNFTEIKRTEEAVLIIISNFWDNHSSH